MPISKTPAFSQNVANKVLKEHGLEGKVTPEQLAEAAAPHDIKNKGYISKDEFTLAAAELERSLADDPGGQQEVSDAQTFSPLFARMAVVPRRADLSDPRIQNAKERVLANVGPGTRFGPIDEGEGLRAFTIDDKALGKIKDNGLHQKLSALADGVAFGVLTTGDEPHLTIASASKDLVNVVAKYDLVDPASAALLGGRTDALKTVAALFGDAPQIELGGENKSWNLGNSDWSSGKALGEKQQLRADKEAARLAARSARAKARDEAMAGPGTIAEFQAAGVKTHAHTAAEKTALLELVKANAKEDGAFPNPDDSYYGLHTFLMEGPEAAHAVAFAVANGAGEADYDPDKHSVLVTIKSFDEAQVGTYVVDRQSMKPVFGDESNAVDYPDGPVEKFFPEADIDEGFDAHVIGTLATRGELLGVVAGESTPDSMDFRDWLD